MTSPTDGMLWFVVELDRRDVSRRHRHGWVRELGCGYQHAIDVANAYFDAYVFNAAVPRGDLYPWLGHRPPERGQRVETNGTACWPCSIAAGEEIDRLVAEILEEP